MEFLLPLGIVTQIFFLIVSCFLEGVKRWFSCVCLPYQSCICLVVGKQGVERGVRMSKWRSRA